MSVTAQRLLVLADSISSMSAEAGNQVNTHGLTEHLNAALACVLNAAKNAAFNEALRAHAETHQSGTAPKEEP